MQNRSHKLINLETYVNEKLKVSKKSPIILDTDIYELSSNKEFNAYLRKVDRWLHSFATKVPKNNSNENELNDDDLYIMVHINKTYKNYMLHIGYKNREIILCIPKGYHEIRKYNYEGDNTGWSTSDNVFIVPDELKDDVIEIINYTI